jgi:hypothetical protein
MTYHSNATVKIVLQGDEDSVLCTHESKPDGTPRCGTRNRDWCGKRMVYRSMGAGEVTCGSCIRWYS